jgi:hypothetical protein
VTEPLSSVAMLWGYKGPALGLVRRYGLLMALGSSALALAFELAGK